MSALTFGSLFSGIGGFDLGLERAGMVPAWNCEIDEKAGAVLARHWPNVERHTDVRTIGAHNLGPVDLICGGFPCQDLSVAGKRAGLAGERSGLWHEFRRILAECRPRWAVIENVPGLLSSNGGRDFAVILRGLVELGYGVCWRVLDAQYFGLAQRRRRVFIVGSLGDGRAAEILFEREGGSGDTPPSRETGARLATDVAASLRGVGGGERGFTYDAEQGIATVAQTLNSGGNDGGFRTEPGAHLVAYGGNNTAGPIDVATAQNAHGGTGRIDFESETFVAHTLTANYGKQVDSSDTSKGPPNIILAHTLRSEGADASEDGTGRGVPMAITGWDAQSKRIHDPAGTAPSLWAGNNDGGQRVTNVSTGLGVRRLMPVECEKLQGFLPGWTESGADGPQSDSVRYRQLGNAVAVPVAQWLGERIMLSESATT